MSDANLHLKIVTPQKIVVEIETTSVTAPSVEGEITILPHHSRLFSQLKAGVLRFKKGSSEEIFAIGGGFLETDGKELNILVSRAYGQDEIDEKQTKDAIERAKSILAESKDEAQIHQASLLLRHSLIDMKLLKKRRRTTSD